MQYTQDRHSVMNVISNTWKEFWEIFDKNGIQNNNLDLIDHNELCNVNICWGKSVKPKIFALLKYKKTKDELICGSIN